MPGIIILLLILVLLAMILAPTKINDATLRKAKKDEPTGIPAQAKFDEDIFDIEIFFS